MSHARPKTAFLLIAPALILGVAAACSDDPEVKSTPDAGADSSTETDGSTNNNCPEVPEPECSAAKCTTDPNDPQVCIEGQCVKLKSQDCQRVGGDLEGANVVVIGASLAQSGNNAGSGLSRINSLELAIKEVNTAGGVRDPDRCKPSRTLAYVACDDSNRAEAQDAGVTIPSIDRVRGAKHLIENLKVPVIVGASTSGNTLDVAENATVPGKTVLFSPSSTAISITTFPASPDGTRLLWRAAPSDVVQSTVLQKMFVQLEAEVKAGNGNAPIKLALVTKTDAYGAGIKGAFKQGLQVNGAAPTEDSLFEAVFPPDDTEEGKEARNAVATQLGTFQPDIVVMAGTDEATDDIMAPFEAANPAKKPLYILADGQKKPKLVTLLNGKEDLRKRIRGVQPGIVTPLAQAFFNFGYKQAYGDDAVLAYGMAGTYDIGYMIAYALTVSKGAPVNGTDFAKNMSFLVGGTQKIDVGSANLSKGMEALLKGEKIDFNGASGPLDFDPATGEAPSDYSIWCVKIDPNTSAPVFEEATGQSYLATTGELTGTYNCP